MTGTDVLDAADQPRTFIVSNQVHHKSGVYRQRLPAHPSLVRHDPDDNAERGRES
jgi:hypothetical protein